MPQIKPMNYIYLYMMINFLLLLMMILIYNFKNYNNLIINKKFYKIFIKLKW